MQQNSASRISCFFPGLLAGVAAAVFFCSVFTGNPLDLILPFLIFFLCFLIASAFPLPEKWRETILFVLISSTVGVLCLEKGLFSGIAGGVLSGLLFRDVFHSIEEERNLFGKFGIGLTAGLAAGWLPNSLLPYVLGAAYLVCFLFHRKWHIILRLLAIPVCGVLLAAVWKIPAPKPENIPLTQLEVDLMLEYSHKPVILFLTITPDNSVFPEAISSATHSMFTALRPGNTKFPRAQMQSIRELFDLILLEIPDGAFHLLTRESFGELRSLLRPGGTLFLLPSSRFSAPWNENVVGTLRAALQTTFPYVYATSHVPMLLASAWPISREQSEDSEMLELVRPLLFQQEWDQKTAEAAKTADIPSDSNFVLESLLFRETPKPPWFKWLLHELSIFRKYALWIFGSVIGLGLIVRYAAAYRPFFAAAFPVFEDTFCIGTTLFFLVSGHTLMQIPCSGWLVLAAILVSFGFFSELPGKKSKIQSTILRWTAVLLPLPAWLLMTETGGIAVMGSLILALLAGSCGAILLQEERSLSPAFCPIPAAAGAFCAVLLSGCLLMPEYSAVLAAAGMLSGISFRK